MRDDQPLPYGAQWLDDDDIDAVVRVLRSDWLTTGPAVEEFERALCTATTSPHAVAVSSGTAALHTAYAAAGLEPDTELLTSPLTFVATASAGLMLGATVRFADVDPATGNLDPAAAAAETRSRTRLIVGVDYAGHPADYDSLRPIAANAGATLVADAAHSLGAQANGRPVGTLADVSTLSFHPVKTITTGEGGAVLTSNADVAAKVRSLRNHGIERDPQKLKKGVPAWYHEVRMLGLNYRLPDVLCALGTSQLAKLDRFIAGRRALAARYAEALGDVAGLELPVVRAGIEPSWHLYVVRVTDAARRDAFYAALREHGILAQVHYIPVYHHPAYRELGFRRGLCPVAEDFAARALSLPMFPRMTPADADRVIDAVRAAALATL
jgi:UDP-4-amino-4,6-dideoxy-N-acetyl-beta-L-altrosamine transaminase